ncbi:hypothetical protein ACWF82_19585 [Nocardia sp. NPDC055053]
MTDQVIAIVGESGAIARLWRVQICLLFVDGGHTDTAAARDADKNNAPSEIVVA